VTPIALIKNLDDRSLLWLNSYIGHWPLLDRTIDLLLETNELSFGVPVALFYWLWFRYEPPDQRKRAILALTALGSLLALLTTRVLVTLLPFRDRPFVRPELHFHIPPGFSTGLRTWSAFPSDHAVLAFALATGFWLVSRPVGVFAFVHAALIICLPRMYYGLHHPSDLLGGALLGMLFVRVLTREAVSRPVMVRVLYFEQRHRGVFYLCFFLLLQQLVVMFGSLRSIIAAVLSLLRGHH
jgi:membrane-associated phospholipid phosphatase